MNFGVASMSAPLRTVAMRRPGPALLNADPAHWHYSPAYDPAKIPACYEAFAQCVARSGAEILWLNDVEPDDAGNADAVFTFDASLMTPKGAILMAPGKTLRAQEMRSHERFYQAHHIPIAGEITGEGRLEAGDTMWLDPQTLVVGRSFRSNTAGIDQLKALLAAQDIEVVAFDLPVFSDPAACLHWLSLISPISDNQALAAIKWLPAAFYELCEARGFRLINAPMDEFEASATLSVNILAASPNHCIMLDGFPKTKAVLEAAGAGVETFDGTALCIGCEGGPTCLTRPIWRQ